MDFDKHNGEGSKKRAENQLRVAAFRERQNENSCNAKNVTLALPDKNIYRDNIQECAGNTTVDSGAAHEPAPTPDVNDESFRQWLSVLCQAHPSASRSLYLAPDVLKAAKAAFVRCPDAERSAELLKAYFKDSRLAEGKFYAPRGQRKFFEDLEDVLSHAERGKKWAGGKPKKKADASEKRQPVKTAGCEVRRCAGVLSDAEKEAFFKEVKGVMGRLHSRGDY